MKPPTKNIESDPLFALLTDALRAGPESVQWHAAVARLAEQGIAGQDEYRMLLAARESLESGKDYREIRAGAGFTRKVMGEIENEQTRGRRSGVPTATIVAALCGILILVGVGYLAYKLSPHAETGAAAAVDALKNKADRFFDTLGSASFDSAMPAGWRAIGSLPLEAHNGLRPAAPSHSATQAAALAGGGVLWDNTIPGDQPFAVEVTYRAQHPTDAVLLEAFVSTDPVFSAGKGTSSRDLVWQLQDRNTHVLLSGSGQTLAAPTAFHAGGTIRLIVGPEVAIVEQVLADNKTVRLWAGPHDLGSGARYVGVRFLQTGGAGTDALVVRSIKITSSSVR